MCEEKTPNCLAISEAEAKFGNGQIRFQRCPVIKRPELQVYRMCKRKDRGDITAKKLVISSQGAERMIKIRGDNQPTDCMILLKRLSQLKTHI